MCEGERDEARDKGVFGDVWVVLVKFELSPVLQQGTFFAWPTWQRSIVRLHQHHHTFASAAAVLIAGCVLLFVNHL
jgi:transposase